jgi:hypothetical protein
MIALLVLGMVQWGFLTGVIANSKNRDAAKWFALGAVLPVIGLGLAIAAPTMAREAPKPPKRKIPARLARLRPSITSA